MWKNLDDLSESDPDTYKSFTENILAEVRTALDRLEWPILNSPALKTKKKNPLDAQGPPSQGGSAKSFVPKASFVVKLKAAKSHGACAPKKIFVNITSHPALERPKDQFGRHAEDGQKRGVDGLQIPLLVGEVRNCADHTGESTSTRAVDVVFHDWIAVRCGDDDAFKAQIVDLALSWVKEETALTFESGWKTIKSKYKGGLGEIGDLPLPFPIAKAMQQEEPLERRTSAATNVVATKDECAPSPAPPLLSPEKIIRAKEGGLEVSADGRIGDSRKSFSLRGDTGSREQKPRVLIEEVKPMSDTASTSLPEKDPKGGNRNKKGAAVKKGFLNSSGECGPGLYGDDGSTGDGQKEVSAHAPAHIPLFFINPQDLIVSFYLPHPSRPSTLVFAGKLLQAYVEMQGC
jgi:hypothetical protein